MGLFLFHATQTDRMKTIGQLWRAMTVEERDKVALIIAIGVL